MAPGGCQRGDSERGSDQPGAQQEQPQQPPGPGTGAAPQACPPARAAAPAAPARAPEAAAAVPDAGPRGAQPQPQLRRGAGDGPLVVPGRRGPLQTWRPRHHPVHGDAGRRQPAREDAVRGPHGGELRPEEPACQPGRWHGHGQAQQESAVAGLLCRGGALQRAQEAHPHLVPAAAFRPQPARPHPRRRGPPPGAGGGRPAGLHGKGVPDGAAAAAAGGGEDEVDEPEHHVVTWCDA